MSPIDEAALRYTREAPERRFERARLEPIVGVEKEDEFGIERLHIRHCARQPTRDSVDESVARRETVARLPQDRRRTRRPRR